VYFTDLVVNTGVEQNALRSSGLTGIDVRGNTNISGIF
jgi:hypothetical protein